MKAAIIYDRLRWEEKALCEAAKSLGMEASLVDSKALSVDLTSEERSRRWDISFQRCISHSRSLVLTRALEAYGEFVINSFRVAEVCGNKLATTLALAKAGVPTPRTVVALSSESVVEAVETLGYPVVLKPFTGSWGRLVTLVRDRETLKTIVEHREEMQGPMDRMYYIQQYVNRPPRDIRAIVAGGELVACVHRHAPEGDWRTNVAMGGRSEAFKPEAPLVETVIRASEAVGGGMLGVDAMEAPEGYMVHEVNNTVEFKGAQSAVDFDIAERLVRITAATLRA